MKSIRGIFGLVGLGCMCSGCLLKLEHNITSLGARGVVLDAQTHSPLSGADVVVSRLWSDSPTASDALTNTRRPVVTTGKDGRFRVPAERHWNLIVDYLIAPYRTPGGTLVVQLWIWGQPLTFREQIRPQFLTETIMWETQL